MFLMNWKVPREENNGGKRGCSFKSTSALITFPENLCQCTVIPSDTLEEIARRFAGITGMATMR